MTTLVAIPYWRHPEYIERAVKSALAQTDRDIHILVLGDGDTPPRLRVRDSRLDFHVLDSNRGTYFCHQLMVMANPHAWYAPVDADDWVEPDHLERMAELGSDAVSPGSVWFHNGNAKPQVWAGRKGRLTYYHVGRFATERLRAIGGYDPSERIGQDTLVLRMLRVSGGLMRWAPPDPTYHRMRHPGSLTTRPETGQGSEARNAARRRNRVVYDSVDRMTTPEQIRAYRLRRVPAKVAADLERELVKLRAKLA